MKPLEPIGPYHYLRYVFHDLTRCMWVRTLNIGYKKIPKAILIANFHGIGNMVLFTPVLQTLRAAYPSAAITMIVANRGTKDVLLESGLINELIEYNVRTDSNRTRFRKIVSYLHDLGFSCSRNSMEPLFVFEANTTYRVGFSYNINFLRGVKFLLHHAASHDLSKHEVLQNLDLLKPLGIETPVINPSFYFKEEDLSLAHQKIITRGITLGSPLIGFHAGSHGNLSKKRWPLENFAKLADALVERDNVQAVFVGDEKEKKDIHVIRSMMAHSAVNLAGLLSLKETAALISTMALFVSNDSGPMHIAAGVGTPVVGIFGPTREAKNAPWPKAGVPAHVIRQPMDCAPCYVSYSGDIECNTLECLKALTPEMVFRACMETLD